MGTRQGWWTAGLLIIGVWSALWQTAAASTEQTLYRFCSAKHCADGEGPHDLAMDVAGNLYGTTMFGGAQHYGTIYEFTPATGAYKVLYSFCSVANCADGRWPFRVRLAIDVAGNLYGTASQGGNANDQGVVFELVRGSDSWQYKVIYTFCAETACADGGIPATGLTYAGASSGAVYDGASPLFGTTEFDGPHDRGVVFELRPRKSGEWVEKILYAFCPDQNQCPDGLFPRVPLYPDAQGRLFGATEIGGKHGNGVVFQLSPRRKHYAYRVIHHFCAEDSCTDGASPFGALLEDASGTLFGTATGGGTFGHGLIYRLSPRDEMHWDYSILSTFDGNRGMRPISLVLGPGGALFGATAGGGAGFGGTLFRFDGALETIYDFCPERGCRDGASPDGLIEDGQGNLLGVATDRGQHHGGTVFQLAP